MPDPLAKSFYRRFREARTGWIRRLAPLLFASAVVLALGGGSAWLLMRFYDGVGNYRSPLAKFPLAGEPTDPIVPQVVLVVVSGLRQDVSREMPTLQHLRAQGASASVVVPYAQARPAWTTLFTGAETEINDTPLLAADPIQTRLSTPESLFAAARRANLEVAIAARDAWQPLIAQQFLNEAYFVGAEERDPAVADRRVSDAAIAFVNNFAPNFLLVHLALPDAAAQRDGATSEAYRRAAAHTDQLLAQLAASMNLRQSVLLVTADYGAIDRGGHGGTEDAVTRVPLVAAGTHIKPGEYGSVQQADIAPTIAALIGSSIPSASQGSILFAMLDMSDVQRANKALALAKQQREIGISYLNAIGGTLSEPALNDPLVARSSLEVKNYESAFSLANLAAQQVQHDMRTARIMRIEKERFARAPLTLLMLIAPLVLFWLRRSLRLTVAAVIAVGIVAMQHLIYLYAGHLYSLSDIGSNEAFIRAFLERSFSALLFGGLLVSIYHWRDEKPSRQRVATTLLLACGLSVYIALIPFALGYYVNGLTLQWYIGDLRWAFMEVSSLLAIVSLSVLAVPAAVVVALAHWLALIVAHRVRRQGWFAELTLRLKNLPSSVAQLFLN